MSKNNSPAFKLSDYFTAIAPSWVPGKLKSTYGKLASLSFWTGEHLRFLR